MTYSEKEEIIKQILAEVNSKGSTRVGYYADNILKDKPVPYNIKSKIEASITSSKEYISRPHPNFKNDFEILRNPDYKKESFFELHPTLEKIFIAFLGGIISAGLGLLALQIKNQANLQLEHKQDSAIHEINVRLDTLQKHIKDSAHIPKPQR
jgi:hypothetical protein